VDETEAFKYERKYLAEYQSIKESHIVQSIVKWIQAANKNVPCKVFIGTSKNKDRTLDVNHKAFWDGDCKNGYANGLGRHFETGTIRNQDAIVICVVSLRYT
jgi:hypothetical protein